MKRIRTIKLDDQFTIQADPHCWILTRVRFGETNPKTGKPKRSHDVSYHADLKTALIKYLDICSKASSEVLEVLERLSSVEQSIVEAVRNLRT